MNSMTVKVPNPITRYLVTTPGANTGDASVTGPMRGVVRWLSRERDVRVARRVDEENALLDGAALDSEDDSDGDSDDEAEDEERDERCDFIWGKGDDAIEFDTSLFPAMRGAAVFPLASSLNHSCDPNCEVAYVDDARVLVVARRTLKPGEELTIAYVDVDADVGERRDELREVYGFECVCERCSREAAMDVARGGKAKKAFNAKTKGG